VRVILSWSLGRKLVTEAADIYRKLERVAASRKDGATPEHVERRRVVDERNAILQEHGVPAPKSGTFGRAKA
jgi:hypothetical protein